MSNLPETNKSLGQHWLTDSDCLNAMCEAGSINLNDTVLEIGPGIGSLTKLLTEQAKEVVAVEIDQTLAHTLVNQLSTKNLTVVQQDILRFDLTSLPPDYKVVANIPYYLTSHLIRLLSETRNQPQTVVLLVQKEVSERVAAGPGKMSLLSVSAQFYWQVTTGRVVPASLFTPSPKVDSQILIMQRRPTPLFPDVDPKQFFRIVKAGFSSRRKTLTNSLAGGLDQGKPLIVDKLNQVGINPVSRPQELGLDQWHALYRKFAGTF